MHTKRIGVAAVAVAGLIALTGCSGGGSSADEAKDDAKTLTVGIKFDQPGMGLKQGSEFTGFDADMAREIAERMGYEVEFTESVSAQRETLIQNGTVDMILATYTINEKRDEVIDFAGPFFVAGQDVLVPADADDIKGPEDLNGKTLCAVEGSNSTERLRDEYAKEAQLYPAQTYSECIELLAAGTVDAVSTDDVILAGYAAQDEYAGQFKIVGKPFSEEPYGVGIKQDSELCEPINEAIEEILSDGTWEKLVAKNLGDSYTPNAELNPPSPRGCDKNL
ncbi:glutamate ABC transporter substrate-binding protein [Agromyces archimandritae]|uniref:Glutamate ABC transporter substrate-binding protein n=1 Tax=Agromyces archimandritae TaxID=2781962 RepID=A0A975IRL2_9MICO|nr:glutamate ABC transporter substrate-binding protein [Agromyces archimandritae]QTX06216.1 glutamate ABC transporter substrate-binding protein [Agromyces archimandritae]